MPSRLFTGKQIKKDAKAKKKVGATMKMKPKRPTRASAKQAIKAIKKKYGKVKDGARYYHRGRNRWAKYSQARDDKRVNKGGGPGGRKRGLRKRKKGMDHKRESRIVRKGKGMR